jgi:hypothetical protein
MVSPRAGCNVEFKMSSHAGNVDLQASTNGSRVYDMAAAVRDLAIVVAFQLILRASMMLRRWNY